MLADEIHDNAAAHGFWDHDRNFGEMIALAHSELSEALEAHRDRQIPVWYLHDKDCPRYPWPTALKPGGCTCVAKPEGVAVELADCIIRCLDTMASLGVDVDQVVRDKMAYNASRPHKHGKAY